MFLPKLLRWLREESLGWDMNSSSYLFGLNNHAVICEDAFLGRFDVLNIYAATTIVNQDCSVAR
jgi:hypothetical protein